MLEPPCEMAGLRIVEETIAADAIDLTTEGVKSFPNPGTLRGCGCKANEHPFAHVFPHPTWTLLLTFFSTWAHVVDVWSDVPPHCCKRLYRDRAYNFYESRLRWRSTRRWRRNTNGWRRSGSRENNGRKLTMQIWRQGWKSWRRSSMRQTNDWRPRTMRPNCGWRQCSNNFGIQTTYLLHTPYIPARQMSYN